MPSRLPPTVLLLASLAVGALAGCGDDGPTTTAASTLPPAMAEQGSRGGAATDVTPPAADLEAYARGGRVARGAEADAVRTGLRAFATAVTGRDAAAACARVVGFEELLRARGQQGTCERLLPAIGNVAAGPTPRDLDLIDDADVVVAGDRATLSVGSEAPVPMRRVDGAWKLDYAAFAATPKGR